MLKINKLYRKDYIGEDIVVERNYNAGVWQDTTETVLNSVTNEQISNQAVVIGNGPSRLEFDMRAIFEHKGGLLGADTVQTYGCNALYRDYAPDFLVARGNKIVKELSSNPYVQNNIVYTSSIHLLEYPNKFYLIPHDPYCDAGTTAAYIAAFDGHKKIFLLGFDNQDTAGYNYNVYAGTNGYDAIKSETYDQKWVADRTMLVKTFDDVDFVWVTKSGRTTVPDEWKKCINLRQVSFRDFVIEADL
jgi:hypothetical protein